MRDHLGYNIPENKTLLNMKGKAKKTKVSYPGLLKSLPRRGQPILRLLS
jgi:hypothetical protein